MDTRNELEAMRIIAEALGVLDDDATRRVLTWVTDKYSQKKKMKVKKPQQ